MPRPFFPTEASNKMAANAKRNKTGTNLQHFIEEMRRYPFLYDKRRPQFKDADLKKKVWMAIGAKFKMTGDEACQKWIVQRNRYNKDRRRLKVASYSGLGTGEIVEPTWGLFKVVDGMLRDGLSENNCSADNEMSNETATSETSEETALIVKSQKPLVLPPCVTQGVAPYNAFIEEYFKMKNSVELAPTVGPANEEIRVQKFCSLLETRLNLLTRSYKLDAMGSIDQIMYEIEKRDTCLA